MATAEAQPYVDPRRLGEPPPMAQQIAGLGQPTPVKPAPSPIPKQPRPAAVAPAPAQIPTPEQMAGDQGFAQKLATATPKDIGTLTSEQYSLATEAQKQEGLAKQAEAESIARAEKSRSQLMQEQAEKQKEMIEQHKRDLQEASPFAPTPETAKDIARLFSLISVAAFGSGGKGRYSGMQTLASLTGAMKGYQAGRKDVFEQDIKNFEENLKVLKSHNDKVNALYEDAMKLLATDKELGLQKIQEIRALDNTGAIAQLARSGQYKVMGEFLDKTTTALQKAKDTADKLKNDFAKIDYEKKKQLEVFREEEKLKEPTIYQAPDGTFHAWDGEKQQFVPVKGAVADMTKLGGTGGTKGSATQGQFENITSSDIGNAYFRINKFLENSKDGKIPTGSKYLRDKGTQSGIIDAYKNYLVNKTMPGDLQKNDAALLGIAFDVVAARAFGRSSGVTDAKIAQVVKQLPVEGDTENTKREKMQILLNQLEEPNKLLPATKRKDALEYMKSPVGLGLYRSFAEKDESGTVPASEETKYDAAKEARYQKWLKENPQ